MTRPPRKRARAPRFPVAGSVLAGGVGQAALVVSGVLAARILGVEDRGYLALLVLFPAVLSQIGSLGLPLAATFALSGPGADQAAIVRALRAPALVQAIALVAVHAVILAAVFADDRGAVRLAALVSLAAVPAALAQQYGLAVLQGEQRFSSFNLFRTVPAVVYSIAVSVIFVVGVGDLPLVTAAWIASAAAAGAVTLAVGVRALRWRGSRDSDAALAPMLRFGLKGLLGSTSPVESFRLDQAVVGLLLSPAALGLYVVGLAFANLPRFVAQSIGYVAYPRVARATPANAARREMWQFFALAVAVCAAIVAALELAAGWLVPLFFGESFSGAVPVTRILLVGALFLGARRVLADGAQGLGRPGLGTVAELSSWLFLLPALALLTPTLGVEGVALALTIAAGLSLALLAFFVATDAQLPARASFRFLSVRGTGTRP